MDTFFSIFTKVKYFYEITCFPSINVSPVSVVDKKKSSIIMNPGAIKVLKSVVPAEPILVTGSSSEYGNLAKYSGKLQVTKKSLRNVFISSNNVSVMDTVNG